MGIAAGCARSHRVELTQILVSEPWELAGVEPVEPAQRFRRTVTSRFPFRITRHLRRAVGEVEADLVGTRHILKAGDAWPTQAFVEP